jgi:hypothetical protein
VDATNQADPSSSQQVLRVSYVQSAEGTVTGHGSSNPGLVEWRDLRIENKSMQARPHTSFTNGQLFFVPYIFSLRSWIWLLFS